MTMNLKRLVQQRQLLQKLKTKFENKKPPKGGFLLSRKFLKIIILNNKQVGKIMKKDWKSLNESYLVNLTNWFLLIAGLINLGVGTWSSYLGNTPIAITSLTAGLVLLFEATIDRFESLKGLGIEAKTKQLDRKLEEADKALNYLKSMTEFTGKTLVEIQTKIGRWNGGPSTKELIEFGEEIRKIMTTTGSDEVSIQNVLIPWAKTLCMDLSFKKN